MIPKNRRREEKHNANNRFDISMQAYSREIVEFISEVGGERPDGRDTDREREWDRYEYDGKLERGSEIERESEIERGSERGMSMMES